MQAHSPLVLWEPKSPSLALKLGIFECSVSPVPLSSGLTQQECESMVEPHSS